MKKHNEGYVLAYVTVILLLFCLIATMILTGAMKNMNNQQSAIQQMKDRYAAEGMIQQAIAKDIDDFEETVPDMDGNVIQSLIVKTIDGKKNVTAQYGSVIITCVIKTDGTYESFEIGAAPVGEVS